ncbi:hypothetical protein [Blastococcus mobilis]|uniref:Uncharacterized protein n=1 Tax=Blastococcus mobilis TaxID=1938746 RepID=A0A238YVT9_9ACTN|nr:hypothetical protein [Blastococcus mobilis]SNR75052.1 hypothetical protein SAMN06272737_12292 [Blastococcus mobilis]
MISTTWMKAPADLLGLGGFDVRPVYGPGLCGGRAERAVAPIATRQRTDLPAVGTALRVRPVTRQAVGHDVVIKNFFDNNGTTLGIHSSRRPQS